MLGNAKKSISISQQDLLTLVPQRVTGISGSEDANIGKSISDHLNNMMAWSWPESVFNAIASAKLAALEVKLRDAKATQDFDRQHIIAAEMKMISSAA